MAKKHMGFQMTDTDLAQVNGFYLFYREFKSDGLTTENAFVQALLATCDDILANGKNGSLVKRYAQKVRRPR